MVFNLNGLKLINQPELPPTLPCSPTSPHWNIQSGQWEKTSNPPPGTRGPWAWQIPKQSHLGTKGELLLRGVEQKGEQLHPCHFRTVRHDIWLILLLQTLHPNQTQPPTTKNPKQSGYDGGFEVAQTIHHPGLLFRLPSFGTLPFCCGLVCVTRKRHATLYGPKLGLHCHPFRHFTKNN